MKNKKTIDINVQEPYYSYLVNGIKTIEGRLNKGKFIDIEVGDVLILNKKENFEVVGRREYKTFKDMWKKRDIEKLFRTRTVLKKP